MRLPGYALQRGAKAAVGGRVIDRIAAEDEQSVDLRGVHRGDKLAHRLQLTCRLERDRRGVFDRRALVAELLVDRMHQRVHGRRLAIAGDDKRRPAMLQEVCNGGIEPRIACVFRCTIIVTDSGMRSPARRPNGRGKDIFLLQCSPAAAQNRGEDV